MLRHLMVVVEAFVEVRLAVAIEVVQDHDLIATAHMDLVADDLQPERLKQAGGDALPGQRRWLVPRVRVLLPEGAVYPVKALDQPNIAVPGADSGTTPIGEKVEAGQP